MDACRDRRAYFRARLQVAEANDGEADDIARQLVFQFQRGIARYDRAEVKAKVRLLADESMRPTGNTARDIGVGAFENKADVSFLSDT